jgi:mRNA-degrading endonuclease RelE of RelBE toxin-antitoxin system
MRGIVLARRAERDLRRIGPGEALMRIRESLEALAAGTAGLDIRPPAGNAPWHRLRAGDYRILYRPIQSGEAADREARWLVARVVHRRDLERAVSTLS